MLYDSLRLLALCLLRTFFKMEVRGEEALPRKTPFLLASNHISFLDPVALGVACPMRVCFLAKEDLFENKLLALLLKNVGAVPLKREKSDLKVMRRALGILKVKPLVIFPQGTRSDSFKQAKAGVGFLCRKASVPVIAAKIYGTDKILPRESKLPKKGRIEVSFSKVTEIKSEDTYEEVTGKVIEKIKSL